MERKTPPTPDRQSPASQADQQQTVELIFAICREEYGEVSPRLASLFSEVADLYAGRWPSHEACAVTYHNFGHALDVCLAAARMLSGWNRAEPEQAMAEKYFQLGMAAGLFHDAGYIKTKGDKNGLGGKFTLIHVERSIKIAWDYLNRENWSPEEVDAVCRMISLTDYARLPDIAPLFSDLRLKAMAQMVATADLVAQMADTDYVHRIDDLFAEFNEVYEFENREALLEEGTRIYRTVQEIKDGTIAFYEQFVLPILGKLGRMDRYLAVFFGEEKNPYQENIAANLSSHILDVRSQWRRLTDIPDAQRQASRGRTPGFPAGKKPAPGKSLAALSRDHLLPWFAICSRESRCPAEAPAQGQSTRAKALADCLLARMLPASLCESLSAGELRFLLKAALLLQNIDKGPVILEGVLEMANEILDCEASSILIADYEGKELLVALPTGPKKDLARGKGFAVAKGLSGWVYRNGMEMRVNDVSADARFDNRLDREIGFVTRSILAIPLHLNENCIGVVEALNKNNDNFTQQDMNVLGILTGMFAHAMIGVLCAQSNH